MGTHHEHGSSPMTRPAAITPAFLDRILALLAPLFLAAAGGATEAAREAAGSALAGHYPRTDNELRLAALVVAFGFAALDTLGRAANEALSLDEVMDLRDNATALSAAGDQSQAMLDRAHRQIEPKPAGRTRRATRDSQAQQDGRAPQDASGSRTMH
jgi:hypothetical protein